MGVHQNFVDLAKRLIDQNGRPVQIKKLTRTPTDSAKPWAEDTVTETFSKTNALFLTDSTRDLVLALRALGVGGQGSESPTVLSGRGTMVLIPAKGLTFEPESKHKIVDGDVEWEISGVDK